jgi:serine/threonine protein kinase/lipopolysaccharide biosynthesis regulator YciM
MGLFNALLRPKPKPKKASPLRSDPQQAVEPGTENWHVGQTLLNDFVVERVLGEGGMGKVHLVKSQTTGTRFAVKRAKGLSGNERRNLLAELQTWIDLPEHPNLVPCRFFRSVDNEVLIFAEYVEGGSLRDWIHSRKLYDGGGRKTLERLLDTAVQFAWGLHCLHELGLVHQDVKPANVMIERDELVALHGLRTKVTDYGLAKGRVSVGKGHTLELGRSILLSSGGFTPAYCSPEQITGGGLDRRTDVWSWGVSILEMFQGGVTWQSGRTAARTLQVFLERNGQDERIPAMPDGVATLLKGCFREDPSQRWKSMETVVQQLRGVYRAAMGRDYSRSLDKIERSHASHVGIGERRTRTGHLWTDPRQWLERALEAEGRDTVEAAEIVARHGRSRRGQLIADVAAYDEARRMYERLVKHGRKDLQNDLAALCHDAAFLHQTADDVPGALALYDQAIGIRERLVNIEGKRDLAYYLALVCRHKAAALMNLGDNRAAATLHDRAIEICERLINVEGQRELAINCNGKAGALKNLGDNLAAVALHDRAIGIHEQLVNVEGKRELANDLATSYSDKALTLRALQRNREAVHLYDRSIQILERVVNAEGKRELANYLAITYNNKALSLAELKDNSAAAALCDRAIQIREQMVNVEGRREFAEGLATFYANKASLLAGLNDKRAAVDLYDRAITILEQLVNIEGRRELANQLASHYTNKGVSVRALGDNRVALELYDRAITISERLVNVEGRRELADDLATLYLNKGVSLSDLRDDQAAIDSYDLAITILERLVNVEGRGELANKLATLYMNKGVLVGNLGDNRSSLHLYDRGIEILERLVNIEGRRELANGLASLFMNKATTLFNLGDNRAAPALYDRAIEIFERLVNVEGRVEFASKLATLYTYKANAAKKLSDARSALAV